jgi:hypothetical protein
LQRPSLVEVRSSTAAEEVRVPSKHATEAASIILLWLLMGSAIWYVGGSVGTFIFGLALGSPPALLASRIARRSRGARFALQMLLCAVVLAIGTWMVDVRRNHNGIEWSAGFVFGSSMGSWLGALLWAQTAPSIDSKERQDA